MSREKITWSVHFVVYSLILFGASTGTDPVVFSLSLTHRIRSEPETHDRSEAPSLRGGQLPRLEHDGTTAGPNLRLWFLRGGRPLVEVARGEAAAR